VPALQLPAISAEHGESAPATENGE
jgi:hypothetical protein